jgi:hypothetical protein
MDLVTKVSLKSFFNLDFANWITIGICKGR